MKHSLHKRGDITDPNNYRGITLISCYAKLFTSILNGRLTQWAETNVILTLAQFGLNQTVAQKMQYLFFTPS